MGSSGKRGRGGEHALFQEVYRTSSMEGVTGWVRHCLSGSEERPLRVTLWWECATGHCGVRE